MVCAVFKVGGGIFAFFVFFFSSFFQSPIARQAVRTSLPACDTPTVNTNQRSCIPNSTAAAIFKGGGWDVGALTQLQIPDAHVALQQVVHLLDGLFLKRRRLQGTKQEFRERWRGGRGGGEEEGRRVALVPHQFLYGSRTFGAKPQGSSACPQLDP